MKRIHVVILLVCWLLLMGYAVARVPSAPAPALANATVTPLIPGPYPTPRIPNELTYYTKRCWPACHYDPAWLSEEPNRLTQAFEDDLSADWAWLREDGKLWSLETSPGKLRITAPAGSTRAPGGDLQRVKNVLTHRAPATHFDILTKVTFDPDEAFQSAGVFVELDDGTIISLGRGTCEEEDDPACLGDGVYLDGLAAGGRYQGASIDEDTVCLMLRRAGNSYVGYYHLSEAGETDLPTHMGWTEVGRCYYTGAAPKRVGLLVSQGESGAAEVSADFDVVTVVERK